MTLRDQVILRYSHPALVARVAARHVKAGIQIGETYEKGTLRVHRYRDVIFMWDLTNAGKRGKKVDRFVFHPAHQFSADEADNFLDRLGQMLDHLDSFDRAVATIKDFLIDFPDSLRVTEGTERGVDIMPQGFKPLSIKGEHVLVEVEYKSFRIKDLDDVHNEETCIPALKGGLKDIPVFYRWVQDNQDRIPMMVFHDVLDAMGRLGIRYHQFCAMD